VRTAVDSLSSTTSATLRLPRTGIAEGQRPYGLDERLRVATAAGGLTALPANFGDLDGDWVTALAENPFEILYLDYRAAPQITPELVHHHHELLQGFWRAKLQAMSQGSGRHSIASKYGGKHGSERLVRSYPDLLAQAYQRLATRSGIEQAYREIDTRLEAEVLARIDEQLALFLVDGELQPDEAVALLEYGDRHRVSRPVVAAHVHERLRQAGLTGTGGVPGLPLEQQLLQTVWKHPSRLPPPAVGPAAPPPVPARKAMVALLLFALAVVVVLVVAAALRSSRMGGAERENVAAPQAIPSPVVTPPVEASVLPTATPGARPEPPPEPREAARVEVARHPPPPVVSDEQRNAARAELAAIRELATVDPGAAIARLGGLDTQLTEHPEEYAAERVDLVTLRGEIQTAMLERQLAEREDESRQRADDEARRRWDQRVAQIESFMKQANYSGAKKLADELVAEPGVPDAVATRARQLADEAVLQLQAVFARAKVKSRTNRGSDPP
jgi:hypothetical protein